MKPTIEKALPSFDQSGDQQSTATFSHDELVAMASQEIAYIDHPVFRQRRAKSWIARQCPGTGQGIYQEDSLRTSKHDPVGGTFGKLAEAPLLTPAGERFLFLSMNYAKSQAERLRHTLRPNRPDVTVASRIQAHLAEAINLRNQIARSNLRLVIALAQPLSLSSDHLRELVSEGFLPLMRAVELFDVERGFRFSTYATWAVRNHLYRVLKRASALREYSSPHEFQSWQSLEDPHDPAGENIMEDFGQAGLLQQLLEPLNQRERTIIAARFGLEGYPASQSLTAISHALGLSKERVRQILLKALAKLREKAAPLQDQLCWN